MPNEDKVSVLTDVVPSSGRKYIYAAFITLGLIIGVLQVTFNTTGSQPEWFDVVINVYAYLSGIGATGLAVSNVRSKTGQLK